MVEGNPDRELIDRAEDLILKLRDVKSCRISTDEFGNIAEVHVVASSDRSPKMIARDVEAILNAELGLAVDYRKIGVVLLEYTESESHESAGESGTGKTSAARELLGVDEEDIMSEERAFEEKAEFASREGQLELLEQDMRIRFSGLKIDVEEDRVEVEVRLGRSGFDVVGSSADLRHSGAMYDVVAAATLHAVTELLDEKFQLCLSRIKEVSMDERDIVVAVVDLVEGRKAKSFVGSAFIGRDANEAAVLAVLDAINRPSGRWSMRKGIHYTIR